jgi:Winged helix DNA-binding domain
VDIARRRLISQHIAYPMPETPAELVAWLGAVQAQDYAGGKWALGLRLPNTTDADIEQALADRAIVRTWPMRGTLHFVAPADVPWMLALLTPRMIERAAARHRQLELDDAIFARSRKLFVKTLQGGKLLSRDAMYRLLEQAGISPAGQHGNHILWRLAHEGLICFGAREGKQQTFVLLDEWLPATRPLDREEALAELARRYFTGHGPATVQDFAWWSGLRTADAKAGVQLVWSQLAREVVGGQTYWSADHPPVVRAKRAAAYLLPPFDEYLVGYKDRADVLDPVHGENVHDMLSPTVVIGGRVVGTWGRSLRKGTAVIAYHPFAGFSEADHRALAKAARRYGEFLGMPVVEGPSP